MFGLSGFKFVFLFLFVFGTAFGQVAAAVSSGFVRGKITVNGAIVYKNADFDSPVLGHLSAGKIFEVFPKLFGAFYRIKVGKVFGYIADHEIQLLKAGTAAVPALPVEKNEPNEKKRGSKKAKSARAEVKKKYPFARTRYFGLSYSSNSYKEDTLGADRAEAAGYFGLKISGPDVLVEGESSSEINIQFHSGIPSYYEKLTGVSGSGLIYLMDFQFQTVSTLSPVVLSWFGFGPLVRYSKFELGLKDPTTGKVDWYRADDMALGLVISLGLGFRMGNCALRPEVKYYWEKEQYWGAGAAFQFEF